MEAIFNMEFYNSGKGIEDLFANYDGFTAGIKQELKGYYLEISDLPKQVTFEDQDEIIAVKVKATKTIKGESPNNS